MSKIRPDRIDAALFSDDVQPFCLREAVAILTEVSGDYRPVSLLKEAQGFELLRIGTDYVMPTHIPKPLAPEGIKFAMASSLMQRLSPQSARSPAAAPS